VKPRTYITTSKAGHHTVTVKDMESRLSVSRGLQPSLHHARSLVPELVEELRAAVAKHHSAPITPFRHA
jgi:hypothetical protein